jgi:hypothetical protein
MFVYYIREDGCEALPVFLNLVRVANRRREKNCPKNPDLWPDWGCHSWWLLGRRYTGEWAEKKTPDVCHWWTDDSLVAVRFGTMMVLFAGCSYIELLLPAGWGYQEVLQAVAGIAYDSVQAHPWDDFFLSYAGQHNEVDRSLWIHSFPIRQ